jgi:hypothetical protein
VGHGHGIDAPVDFSLEASALRGAGFPQERAAAARCPPPRQCPVFVAHDCPWCGGFAQRWEDDALQF